MDKKYLYKRIIKVFIITFSLIILFVLSLNISKMISQKWIKQTTNLSYLTSDETKTDVSLSSNFFMENLRSDKVPTITDDSFMIDKGYEVVSSNNNLILYLNRSTLGIAIYDTVAKYIWYSSYQKLDDEKNTYTDSVKQMITSGVSIECFDSSTLNEVTKYYLSMQNNKYENSSIIKLLDNGFQVDVDFKTVGISFSYIVQIKDNTLTCKVLKDSVKEVPYKTAAMKVAKEYKLKSITLFPYFGCENYEINGYAFIPDGSGALISFNEKVSSTGYIKRVYGIDSGIQNASVLTTHITNQNDITLPVFGINHGYQQAAFTCEITSGFGSTEIHSYPYMYDNINLNRTFFKYISRDKFLVKMSSNDTGSINLINDTIYPNDYEIKYTFLENEAASFIGMAKSYQKNFTFSTDKKSSSKLHLTILGEDYKMGIFGKNFKCLTSYKDTLNILSDLEIKGIDNLELSYIGWNQNGYYNNTPINPKASSLLGGASKLKELNNYLNSNNIRVYYCDSPLITSSLLDSGKVKRTNLELFTKEMKSSLPYTGYLLNVDNLSEKILKEQSKYQKLNISSLILSEIGSMSYSYRYQKETIYREEMIKKMIQEVSDITSYYNLALSKPNAYLYNYLSSYYDANITSSNYSFETSSVPFVSMILSGKIPMYSSYINFMSNKELLKLRLIEYNINPSFIITEASTNELRYMNTEYLYTTEYNVLKALITSFSSDIINTLSKVNGSEIVNYKLIKEGISEIIYDNGISIYINYTDSDFVYQNQIIYHNNYSVRVGAN